MKKLKANLIPFRILILIIFSLLLLEAKAQREALNQQNYNTSGTNVGTNNGTININNYPVITSDGAINSKYHDPECASRNCGDICFFNATDKKVSVSFNYSAITINPREANCFYQVKSGVSHYNADLDPDNRIMNPANPSGSDHMRSAQVLIEQCKSKTIVIH